MIGSDYKVCCGENDYDIKADEFKLEGSPGSLRYDFYRRGKLVASFPFFQVEGVYLEDDE